LRPIACRSRHPKAHFTRDREALRRAVGAKKIVPLRADWTNKDARITAELARYDRSAVPFHPIWLPGKNDPVILPELLTASTVLDALKKG
jgi:thiol:disulfide interchange protein DsbD